jgi:hypothetical protein
MLSEGGKILEMVTVEARPLPTYFKERINRWTST